MRVIKLDNEFNEGNTEEKPESAWRPLEEGGNSLGCSTNWVASLGLIRKYEITK